MKCFIILLSRISYTYVFYVNDKKKEIPVRIAHTITVHYGYHKYLSKLPDNFNVEYNFNTISSQQSEIILLQCLATCLLLKLKYCLD